MERMFHSTCLEVGTENEKDFIANVSGLEHSF